MSQNELQDLQLNEEQPISHQITDFLRSQIRSGVLGIGQRLPSHQELADGWGVKPTAVHHALQPLVREGLLSRKPRVGTFVKGAVCSIQNVAIYLDGDVWHEEAGEATRMVLRALCEELHQRQVGYQNYVSPSPMGAGESQRVIGEQLIRDVKAGHVQAVLAPLVCSHTIHQLMQLKLPLALACNGEHNGAVNPSMRQFIDKGLVELARQGCRSVGLINVVSRDLPADNLWRTFYQVFQQRAGELGLHVDPAWVVMPGKMPVGEADAIRFGYAGMQSLCERADRPEGVLVYTDRAARGVIDYVQQEKIGVPEDIKLVMHCNRQLPLAAPFAATYLAYDLARVAQTMVELVDRQFQGIVTPQTVQGFDLLRQQPTDRIPDENRDTTMPLYFPLMTSA